MSIIEEGDVEISSFGRTKSVSDLSVTGLKGAETKSVSISVEGEGERDDTEEGTESRRFLIAGELEANFSNEMMGSLAIACLVGKPRGNCSRVSEIRQREGGEEEGCIKRVSYLASKFLDKSHGI